ncbi:MAG: hypothetical protein K6E17_06690 [Clostridiales bacterium]|nr:hypothetical protein [Clostridiales bacterium]
MDKFFRRILPVLLLILLASLTVVAGEEENASPLPAEYEGYEFVTASDRYEMYLYEPQLSLVLRNRDNGSLIASTLNANTAQGKLNKTWTGYTYSGFVIDVLTGNSKNYKQADLVTTEHSLDVTYTEGGFDAAVFFPEYGLGLTMQVRLEGDELLITVPDSSIREETEGVYMAMVSVAPLFGATYMDQRTGYMLIPDGNGALIYLTDKEERFSTGYSQMIYGSDAGFTENSPVNYLWDRYETVLPPRTVLAPVFGMAHTDEQTGFLAIVEQGEKRCSIEAHPNGVMRVSYNRCFAKFLLRDVYKQPLNQSESTKMDMVEQDRTHHDLAVRYCLLSGENANWVGMAKRYRQYLLDEGILTPRMDEYRTRVDFLAEDQEKFLVSTRAVVMTTAAEASEIIADLKSAGVSSLLCEYRGWQGGGIWSLPVSSFSADGAVGGNAGVQALVRDAAARGAQVYPYVDAMRMNASTNTFTYDAAKMINKTTLKEESAKQVYSLFYRLLPGKTAEKLQSLSRSLKNAGIGTLAVGGITENLFSWSERNVFHSRDEGAEIYAAALSGAAEDLTLALEEPFQYQWPEMSAFLNMPLDGSEYMYTDEEVPFLTTALQGVVPLYSDYVNFEANKTELFLQLAETGVRPSFYVTKRNSSALIYTNSSDLYSTEYAAYRDTIIAFDRELRALAEATAGAVIENHEKPREGLSKVTWSNGTVVYVNHTGETLSADGIEIAPRSFRTGGEAP